MSKLGKEKKRILPEVIGIFLLVVVNLVLFLYCFVIFKTPEQKIPEDQVMTVAAAEQTEVVAPPALAKEEYVSEIPEGVNFALDKKVTASSFVQTYNGKRVNDGDAEKNSYWEGAPDDYPCSVTVDLGEMTVIHAFRLRLNPLALWSKRVQNIAVFISDDGETFQEFMSATDYTFDPDRGNEVILTFDEIKTQHVKLEFYSNTGANSGQLAEIEIYGKQ